MTLWHKRLIVLGLKILAVIIIILLIVIFLYYKFYFAKDNLIKYIPANALVYATFSLDEDLFDQPIIKNTFTQFKQDYNLPQVDLTNVNNYIRNNLAVAVLPSNGTDRFQPDYLLVLALKPNLSELDKTVKMFEQTGLNYELLVNNTLEHNILIVSNSIAVLEQVKKINTKEADSLASKINIVVNLRNINSWGKVYIDFERITEQLSALDIPDKYNLVLASFKQTGLSDLFLGLNYNEKEIILETSKPLSQTDNPPLLIDKLPQNFQYSLSFNQADQRIEQVIGNLKLIDQDLAAKIMQNKQYWQEICQFDWETDIEPLLSNQGQLVVDQKNNWLIILDLSHISDLDTKMSQIEQIIKQYVAQQNPDLQQKQLPDYTYITQIVKNPDELEFFNEEISNISVKSLKKEQSEFAYYLQEKQLFLANSRQLLVNLIKKEDIIPIAGLVNDNLANSRQNIIINRQKLQPYSDYLSNIHNLIIFDNLSAKQLKLIIQ